MLYDVGFVLCKVVRFDFGLQFGLTVSLAVQMSLRRNAKWGMHGPWISENSGLDVCVLLMQSITSAAVFENKVPKHRHQKHSKIPWCWSCFFLSFCAGWLFTSTTSLVGVISWPVILHRTLPDSSSSRSWCASIKLFHNSLGGCDMILLQESRQQDDKKRPRTQEIPSTQSFHREETAKCVFLQSDPPVVQSRTRMCNGQTYHTGSPHSR